METREEASLKSFSFHFGRPIFHGYRLAIDLSALVVVSQMDLRNPIPKETQNANITQFVAWEQALGDCFISMKVKEFPG